MSRVRGAVFLVALVVSAVAGGVRGFVVATAVVVAIELVLLRWHLPRSFAVPAQSARTRAWLRHWHLHWHLPWRRRAGGDTGDPDRSGRAVIEGIGRIYPFASRENFDLALRPRLVAAATVRLADHHGVDLDNQPQEARRLLGEDAWDLLGPAPPVPAPPVRDDADAGAVDLDRLDRTVRAIEEL